MNHHSKIFVLMLGVIHSVSPTFSQLHPTMRIKYMLNKQLLRELYQILKEDCNLDLSEEQVTAIAVMLLGVFGILVDTEKEDQA